MSEDNRKEDENLGSFYMGRMRPPPEPERVLPRGLLTGVTVLGFLGLIWYAYPQGEEKYAGLDVPVIKADTSPYKSKPENPGGMEVRHQDSTIFETIDKKGGAKKPEKILPRQEEPIDRKKLGLDSKKPQMILQPELKPPATKPEIIKPVPATPMPKKTAAETRSTVAPAKAGAQKPAAEDSRLRGNDDDGAAKSYIQLGAFKSEDEAEKEWAAMQGKYKQLKGLSMRLQKVDLGKKGTYHRLQAAVKSPAETCAALKKAGADCLVVK